MKRRMKTLSGKVPPRKALLGLIGLAAGYLFVAPSVAADDWQQVAHYALQSKLGNLALPLPWVDALRIDLDEPNTIRRADGNGIMSRPTIVHSQYDPSVTYDVSRFYRADKPRVNFLLRYAGRRAGEVISFGSDSGYSAAKIRIAPAVFAGYTRAFRLRKQTYLTFGLSAWLGGKVTEKACFDAYNRAYYCPTLTAWSDHIPIENRHDIHSSLVFTRVF